MSIRFHINPESGTVARCTAQKKCRFGGESGQENHYNSTAEARKGYEELMTKKTVPTSASSAKVETPSLSREMPPLQSLTAQDVQLLVRTASAYNARTLRKYRRLLEYCNLETAKRMKAQGDTSAEVALAIEVARSRAAVEDRENRVANASEMLKKKNLAPATKKRYQDEHTRLRGMLTSDRARLTKNEQKVSQQIATLDKGLSEHALAVSRLQSYRVATGSGAIPPAQLGRPLEQLPPDSKNHLEGDYIRNSEGMLNALNSMKPENMRQSARASGNDYHIASTEGYISHDKKIERLESRMLAIRDALDAHTKTGIIESSEAQALRNEHSSLLSSRDHEIRVKKVYAKRLEMFRSEIKDDLAYYNRAKEEIRESIESS